MVALDFFVVDTLASLGVTSAGIAGTDKTRVPAYLADKVQQYTDVGERKEPNLEVIRSVEPDLIGEPGTRQVDQKRPERNRAVDCTQRPQLTGHSG